MAESPQSRRSAIALVDGEHYPDVTRDTLRYLEESMGYRVVAIVFLGGTEKLSDPGTMSFNDVPLYTDSGMLEGLRVALSRHRVEEVVDLSDEPVLGYRERFRLISEALAHGVSYRGADFFFRSPDRPYLCEKASIGVWGSGKRVGKTAVSGYLARHLLGKGIRLCVCTMGRGGPPDPELLDVPLEVTDEYLRGRVERGCHAASDHFENAMMGQVVAVGCRRCGGGMAGEPFCSNVRQGAGVACGLDVDTVIFEGSGAAIPPVGVDAVLLAVSAAQPLEYILGYLGPYRLLLTDLVVVTMCEEFLVSSEKLGNLIDGVYAINPTVKVVKTVFRPRPLDDLTGKKVFLASTAPAEAVEVQGRHLARQHGALVIGTSPNLADRGKLEEDLKGAIEAEVMITELKAAGVDTVSRFAKREGKSLVYIENRPVSVEGDLDDGIDHLLELAMERHKARQL
ncbi:MAG: 2,3-diphosphoglycerate synthetase [Actinomycetia bacterium]|nr:2,3-diphosphoglycerate synthetase [Actinomycetes bacterium]